jgi:hypothetical protein
MSGESAERPVRIMTSAQPEHEWTASWLRGFLTKKEVMKPNRRWDLSDNALLTLATNILIRSEFHGRPMAHHPWTEAFLDEEDQHRAAALRKGLERRREAAKLQLAEWKDYPTPDDFRAAAAAFPRAEWKDHPTPDDLHVRMEIERINETIDKLAAAISALDDVAPILKPYFIWPRNITYTHWHDHAVELARYFGHHLRECNPSRRFGISEKGPVVGFVTAVIPLITGENPDDGTVYKYLIRHIGPRS